MFDLFAYLNSCLDIFNYLRFNGTKPDVRAARERNGVYIPLERFLQDEAEKKALESEALLQFFCSFIFSL